MVEPIDNKEISPSLQATYKNEFTRGVKLFEESLQEYQTTDNMNAKAKFKDVMDKSLHIMNQAARGFLLTHAAREKGEKVEKQVSADYQAFLQNDDDSTYQQLKKDIDDLKGLT